MAGCGGETSAGSQDNGANLGAAGSTAGRGGAAGQGGGAQAGQGQLF